MTACTRSAEPQPDTEAMQSAEFQCSICFELMVDPVVGTCGHAFCKRCMDDWKASRQRLGQTVSCPQCRTNLLPASSTQQFGVCIRLRETISKLFPVQSAARRHEVEEWDKQMACDEERARSSADTSTSTAPAAPAAPGSPETMEAYRELTRRVLAALVTTNPEAAAEAVGLLPSPRTTQRPPSPAEQEQEARQRYASLQSSMALLTGAMEAASPTSMPQTPTSHLQSPTTPHAPRAQEQAAQHAQQQAQAQAAQQQQAHLQAVQQHQQAQAQPQATAPLQQQRQSAADATRERQVQAVRRQQQAHEVRGVQLARLLASLIAEGTDAQAQQQHAQVQAQQVAQPQQAQTVASSQRAPLLSPTTRAQHTQQAVQQASQQRPMHTRQHAAPRTGDSTQVSAPSRTLPQGPAYQCPALTQRVHSHDTTAAQHQRRQQQHYHAQQQQQQQWAASQPGWGRTRYDNSSAMRSGYPCMMQPMLVPANSTWPYVVSMPVSYTMYG